MTKMRKEKFIAIAVLAAMLAGCSQNNTAEETTAAASAEITESTTTMSEATTVSVTLETTEKVAESEETESPKVIPADEVYDVYPMRIIYPEKTETNITVVEEKEINEEFKNGEFVVYKFSAAYPVFSGGDEAVTEKINGYIKNYVDSICDELEWDAAAYDTSEYDIDSFPYSMCGFFYERSFDGGYGEDVLCDVNGNILSVYFENYTYGAGAMHGIETPLPMVFDLRTGERVDFNKIIGDADGLSEVLSKALYDYLYTNPYSTRSDVPDNYAEFNQKRINGEFVPDDWVEFGFDDEGDYVAAMRKANYRMTVHSGCLCFYLAGYEYGSYADGIRRIDVPIKDVLPYLTEEGQALFEGYTSAESKPANIISENGVKSFDTGGEWEEPHLLFSDKPGRS